MRSFVAAALGAAAAFAAASSAAARPVDLELVLAVDVSGSIDAVEGRLQREGYAAALRDPAVLEAIQGGEFGRIALAYVEWAGDEHRVLTLDWHEVHDAASAERFAAELDRLPITTGRRTSISGAIDFSLPLFDNAFDGLRRTLDVSGDGANNDGRPVTVARDAAVAAGVTINGLPILNDRPNPFGFPVEKDLDLYYQSCVIGGPGAFIVVARDFHAFAAAIRRKLILEIARRPPPDAAAVVPAQFRRDEGYAPGCDIGERRLREYFGGAGPN